MEGAVCPTPTAHSRGGAGPLGSDPSTRRQTHVPQVKGPFRKTDLRFWLSPEPLTDWLSIKGFQDPVFGFN